MTGLDWNAEAMLHARGDPGSELHHNFTELMTGPLRAVVAAIAAMDAAQRARLVIAVAGGQPPGVNEILGNAQAEGLA